MQQFEWIHAAAGNRHCAGNYCQRLLKFSTASAARSTASCHGGSIGRVQRPVAGGWDRSLGRLCAVGRLRYRGDHRRRLGAVWSASE